MDPEAHQYTYQEFPQHYVWNKQRMEWIVLQQGFAIGRLYFVDPTVEEKYYLRMLLTTVRGCTSFEDLCTVNGQKYATF